MFRGETQTNSANGYQQTILVSIIACQQKPSGEFAARGGTQSLWAFGDVEEDLADFDMYQTDGTAAVASKQPNPFGLFDVHGNVLNGAATHLTQRLI